MNNFWMALSFLAALVAAFGFVMIVRDRLNAGKVLLDIGPVKNRTLLILMAFSMCLAGGSFITTAETPTQYFIGFTYFFIAILSTVLASARVQMCENGFYNGGTLYKWKQIESHEFGVGKSKGFIVQLNIKRRPGLSPLAIGIPVPLEKKDAIQEVLEQHHIPSQRPERLHPEG